MAVECLSETVSHLDPWQDPTLNTDILVASLGCHSHTKHWPAEEPPLTRPVVQIENQRPLRHVIHFMDEDAPKFEDKPTGVRGVEIWVKLGTVPPVNPNELTLLAWDTCSPYVAQYPSKIAGESAHYQLRWVNDDGEKGPWSSTFSAIIGG
jgi:hypothetical protein